MGFVRELVKVGSFEDAVDSVGLFFVAKKAGAQRFIIVARASNGHFKTVLQPVAHKRGTSLNVVENSVVLKDQRDIIAPRTDEF